MSLKNRFTFVVIALFVLLTFIHLLPLSLHPSRSVSETIDSLLNTWILSHVRHKSFSHPLKLFEANIFYPHPNTLTYSEHLLPQALISLPVDFIFRNPILAYNFVFLLAYFLNGYVMFLFVRHLTKSHLAGIACGIMFAFNTYNFNHISHLQLLHAWPIPLSFLFLHKYFEDGRLKNSVLFSLVFALQGLCCIYYGLFTISMLVVILPVFYLLYRKEVDFPFLAKLGLPLIFAASVLFVFSLPYLSLFRTFGFQRGLSKGADLVNYLAVNPHNVFLARFFNSLGRHEYFLSPGVAALFLAACFLLARRKLFRINTLILRWVVCVFSLINALVIVLIQWTGGFSLDLSLFRLSAHNVAKPAFTLYALGLLILLVGFLKFVFKPKEKASLGNRNVFLYAILFSWSLLLSFGSHFNFLGDSTSVLPLPFQWFYNYLPGFKGIRVPSRCAIFVIFSVVVIAGYGIKYLGERIKSKKFAVLASAALLLFLNLEYLSLPQRIRFVPIKQDIPLTYDWLKERPKEATILELPFRDPIGRDAIYMYFSIFHKKRMVNGYSGFFPPAIYYIRKMFRAFPSWASLDILRALSVDYVVLHKKMWKEIEARRVFQTLEKNFADDLQLKNKFQYSFKKPNEFSDTFGEDFIYQVVSPKEKRHEGDVIYQEIPPDFWEVTSNREIHLLPHLKDNDWETRWTSGRIKTSEDYLLIEFKEPIRVDKFALYQGEFTYDYALRIRVETSADGERWSTYHRLFSPGEFVLNLVSSPLHLVQNVNLPGEKIKFLKIVQFGNDKTFWWSAVELKIFEKAKS